MRWENLFADLEAQLVAEDRAEFEAEVADRTRAERSGVELASRLRAQQGRVLVCHLADGEPVRGTVAEAGLDWFLMTVPEGSVLVPQTAVVAYEGLGAGVIDLHGPLARRLTLGVVLRGLSRNRELVTVALRGGRRLAGVIEVVGRDHLDLTPRDDPGQPASGARVTLPYAAVLRVLVR